MDIDLHWRSGRDERDEAFSLRRQIGEIQIRAHRGGTALTSEVRVPLAAYPEVIAFVGMTSKYFETHENPGHVASHAGDANIYLVLLGRWGTRRTERLSKT